MHIYFRTDGNEIIATGHVMRCLSIADAFKELKHEVTFIVSDNLCHEMIYQRGYDIVTISGKWNDLEYELDELEQVISVNDVQILIIDSYYVTSQYLQRIGCLTKTVYIDDLNAFLYPVDVIINYSLYADKLDYRNRYPDTELLLGCDYVPLRSQFTNIDTKVIHKQVKSILVTSGGTDCGNMVLSLLRKMNSDIVFKNIDIHVVVGVFNSNFIELYTLEKQSDNVTLHHNVKDMVTLMKGADVAISAGGSTLYELGACGVPTITYFFADNQISNVREFEARGLMDCAGDAKEAPERCAQSLYKLVVKLVPSYVKRKKLSEELMQLIDGNGAMRIARRLQSVF